ncbi:MAG: hypothetical protein IT303_02950 [Dehalococcoidia bacterium]|nr:hypothetical protein [Dehalococcoidia bacterium]
MGAILIAHRALRFAVPAAIGIVGAVLGSQVLPTGADDPPAWVNPDAGLTDAERDAKYQAGSAASDRAHAEFRHEFERSGQDPRPLERVRPMIMLSEFEANDLAAAAERADLVVIGRVTAQTFAGPYGGNEATVAVREVLKGEPRESIVVYQFGGPETVGGHTFLGEAEWDPLLLEGDEVLLFLAGNQEDGRPGYHVLTGAGSYFFEAGKVRVAEANPQLGRFSFMTPAEVLAEAKEYLAKNPWGWRRGRASPHPLLRW